MNDLSIRKDRQAGRITFTRPKALNALSHDMARAIHKALDDWRDDPDVKLVIIDAEGEKAFCAGGDVAAVYHAAREGDHSTGQEFFADEYRMNAALADYSKPIVAFMQGFVMGGGVGVGGHAAHRVVGDTTQIAMPETLIGLVPDVGGSWLLAHAPGRIGEYLGLTGARMGAGDAIHAGFADHYVPEAEWSALIDQIAESGDLSALKSRHAPHPTLADRDLSAFGGRTVADILRALEANGDAETLGALRKMSPLSLAVTLQIVRAARGDSRMQESLSREYRYTSRATQMTDFLEGVRAQVIDKDRSPHWSYDGSAENVAAVTSGLGKSELVWPDAAA